MLIMNPIQRKSNRRRLVSILSVMLVKLQLNTDNRVYRNPTRQLLHS